MQWLYKKKEKKQSNVDQSHSRPPSKRLVYPPTFVPVCIHTFPPNLNQRFGTQTRYALFGPNTLMQLEFDTALCLKRN